MWLDVLEKWLRERESESSGLLELHVLDDEDDLGEAALYDWLGRELTRNYVAPGELAAIFENLDAPEVAEHLKQHKFPTVVAVRNGDFGEALTGALFRRVRRWCVPILKLRYKQRPNQPVQGADVLGFRLRLDPPVVAVPEVKTRTTRRLDIGVKANESLGKVLADLPSSITFVVARLHDRGNALAGRIAKLLCDGYVVERHIVLVHDEGAWSQEVIDCLQGSITAQTQVTVIRVDDLDTVIKQAFAAAADRPMPAAGSSAAEGGERA